MKIAFVASGYIPKPPLSNSILTLLQGYKYFLEQGGHQIDIFNSKNVHQVIEDINQGGYDFVHLHASNFVQDFSEKLYQKFCFTSHNGYLLNLNQWDEELQQEFPTYLRAPGIIALSPAARDLFLNAGYSGYLAIQINGVNSQQINYQPQGNGKAVCLGWIQPRKQQRLLAEAVEGKLAIDFVGPLDDPDFCEGTTTKYLGIWSLEQVYQRLTNYSCLVLLSKGEVAPLVVLEAMAAGLSLVISESASANLQTQDFIKVLPDCILSEATATNQQIVCEAIQELTEKNQSQRADISTYARQNFDFSHIIKNYLKIVDEFNCSQKSFL